MIKKKASISSELLCPTIIKNLSLFHREIKIVIGKVFISNWLLVRVLKTQILDNNGDIFSRFYNALLESNLTGQVFKSSPNRITYLFFFNCFYSCDYNNGHLRVRGLLCSCLQRSFVYLRTQDSGRHRHLFWLVPGLRCYFLHHWAYHSHHVSAHFSSLGPAHAPRPGQVLSRIRCMEDTLFFFVGRSTFVSV